MNLETLATVCSGLEVDFPVTSEMGTIGTRSSKTLGSPELDKIEPPKEKILDLTEKHDDSVAIEEGQENGFSDLGEASVTGKDGVSVEENGVSLGQNDNKPEDEDYGDDDDDDGHGFSVGDFVWGKIKSHPWWPGQIYDPANVSEFAAKIRHKGKHLVAYFGDGTFAWCKSSQLKPFEESFDEMSKQSTAKGFIAAVQQAVDEIGRVLELSTTCSCIPEQNKTRLVRLVAENAGVKEGSLVPNGKIRRFSDVLAEPTELLSALKSIARSGCLRRIEVVELCVLTSRVSSFYRSKGTIELPRYRDPVRVPGLEDKAKSTVEIPAQGPSEEDWLPLPIDVSMTEANQPLLRSCPLSSDNKRNSRRKQRSIADLIATEGASSEKKKIKASSASKKRKRGDEEDLDGDQHRSLKSLMAKDRKKTGLSSLGSRSSTRISDIADTKKDSKNEDGDSAVKKILEKSPSYREKKKSKYLSPPFTDVNGGKRKNGEGMTELPKLSVEDQSQDKIDGYQKKANVSTNKLLSEVRSTAADPFSQRGKKSAEMVSDFISVYRDSVYCNGAGDEAENTPRTRKRKRTISVSEMPNQSADESPEANLSSAADNSKEKRAETRGRKKKQVTEAPEVKKRTPNRAVGKSPETNQSLAADKPEEKRVETRGRNKKLATETPEVMKRKPNQPVDKSPEINPSSAADKSEEKRVEARGRKKKQVTKTSEVMKKTPNQPVDKSPETNQSSAADKLKENKVERRGRKKKQKQVTETQEAEKRTVSKENATKSADDVKSRGRKKKKLESETPEAKNKETIDEKTLPATLVVEFAPASILPSKADLISMYEKYGDLDKAKTDMYYANQCARVYFQNGSEAQIAYTESKAESPFGSNSVEFVLECPSREYKTRVLQEITSGKKKTPKKASKDKPESELRFVKSKLETISSMLDEKDEKMSRTMKSKLKGEISGLLEKVSSMVVGSSSV